ncbi:putative defense protein Hdd11-like [Gastrophryne carolinensis]
MGHLLKKIFLLVTIFSERTLAFSTGKVAQSCASMIPQHHVGPQTTAAPYNLTVSTTTYKGRNAFLVTLAKKQGGNNFKGFMIQAHPPNGTTALGSFVLNSADAQTLNCGTAESAVSHTSSAPKSNVTVIWLPTGVQSPVQFCATVVEKKTEFWTDVRSDTIPLNSAGVTLLGNPVQSKN